MPERHDSDANPGQALDEMRRRVEELEGRLEEQSRIVRTLETERDRARLYLDIAGAVLVVIEPDESVSEINRMGCEVLGRTQTEIIGANWFDTCLPERLREPVRQVFRQLMAGEVEPLEHFENPVVTADGEERIMAWHNAVLHDEGGSIVGTLSSGLDITDRVRAERALVQSEERFRMMGEVMPLMFWMVSPDWQRVHYVSRAAETILGCSPSALCSDPKLWLELIHREDRDHVLDFYQSHHGEQTELEYRVLQPQGSVRWIRDVATPLLDQSGELVELMGFAEDITERRRAQSQLQASVREKDLLLRELHHRIKNNLQVISSLIEFQCDALEDQGAAAILKDLHHRIRSMAFIHEHLHRFADLARVDVEDLIRSLVHSTTQAFGASGRLSVEIQVEPLLLSVDQVLPCGLALGELVSNALKHAFPDIQGSGAALRPRLTVQLREQPPGSISLTVGDNGVGLPPDVDWHDSPSLGLQLVGSLVDQLGGQATVERRGGTTVTITFPATAVRSF